MGALGVMGTPEGHGSTLEESWEHLRVMGALGVMGTPEGHGSTLEESWEHQWVMTWEHVVHALSSRFSEA